MWLSESLSYVRNAVCVRNFLSWNSALENLNMKSELILFAFLINVPVPLFISACYFKEKMFVFAIFYHDLVTLHLKSY